MPPENEPIKLDAVPLFPLPNVVLFPRTVLPLHIFEFRYRQMTADAVAGDRLVALSLLKPGWEKDYHARPAIEPVVCVGRILNWEKLADGKYNFLLQGVARARIEHEFCDRTYRYARLSRLEETDVMEIDLQPDRERLSSLVSCGSVAGVQLFRQFRQFIHSPLPTRVVADLAAFHLIEHIALKQQLLAETDVRKRVRQVVAAVEAVIPTAAMLGRADDEDRACYN